MGSGQQELELELEPEPELELLDEIHSLISLLVNQHVKSWYSDLSQDELLFSQLRELTDHVHNKVSCRAQDVDWDSLIFEQLPEIFLRHLQNFNIASERCNIEANFEECFLNMQSHPGIDDQHLYLANVSDGLLTILLPPEDLISHVAYGFMRELMSELILKGVLERLSDTWLWDELFVHLLTSLRAHTSFQTIKAFFLSSWHNPVSCFINGLRNGFRLSRPAKSSSIETLPRIYGSIYHTALPDLIEEAFRPSRLPIAKPILLQVLLPITDFLAGPAILRASHKYVCKSLSQASLARIIRIVRQVMFPNGLPSASRVTPTQSEQTYLKATVDDLLPLGLRLPFLRSKMINKILLFNVLDKLLGSIFPELQNRSPQQLREKAVAIMEADREAGGAAGLRTGRPPHAQRVST